MPDAGRGSMTPGQVCPYWTALFHKMGLPREIYNGDLIDPLLCEAIDCFNDRIKKIEEDLLQLKIDQNNRMKAGGV